MKSARPAWRRRLLPAAVALAALNLLVLAVYTLPRSLSLRKAAERAAAARAELAQARAVREALQAQMEAVSANAKDTRRFYEVIGPSDRELLPVLEEVERIARVPGLKIGRRGYRQAKIKGAARLQRVSISVPIEGSYEDLVRFLDRVEASPRFLTVDKVALSNSGQGGMQLSVQLSAYFTGVGPVP
jgi:Tfp pilus assembly protein PilO